MEWTHRTDHVSPKSMDAGGYYAGKRIAVQAMWSTMCPRRQTGVLVRQGSSPVEVVS